MSEFLTLCKGQVEVPATRFDLLKQALRNVVPVRIDLESGLADVFTSLDWEASFDEKGRHLTALHRWSGSEWRYWDEQVIACVAEHAIRGCMRVSSEFAGNRAYVFNGACGYTTVRGDIAFGEWRPALAECVRALTTPTDSDEVERLVARAKVILDINQD